MSATMNRLEQCGLSQNIIEVVTDDLRLSQAKTKSRGLDKKAVQKVDMSDVEIADVERHVDKMVDATKIYLVYWLYESIGVSLSGKDIGKRISDIWLPAVDDVVVFDADFLPVFLLDHEEIFYFNFSK